MRLDVAFLFPGHTAERVGMGLDIAERSEIAQTLLARASAALDRDVCRVIARGDPALSRIEVLLPVLTAVSLGACAALRAAGVQPGWTAGHSLGEIAAWSGTGAVLAEDAIDLAVARGAIVGREAASHPGGMIALEGCDRPAVERALADARSRGPVDLAAHNAPNEWVVSGAPGALRILRSLLGGTVLRVAGPFHCRMLSGALDELRRVCRAVPRARPECGLVVNRTGEPAASDEIPELLAEQLVRPVEWCRTLETLHARGVTTFVTVGPGAVLRYFVRRCLGASVRVLGTEDAVDLDHTIRALERP